MEKKGEIGEKDCYRLKEKERETWETWETLIFGSSLALKLNISTMRNAFLRQTFFLIWTRLDTKTLLLILGEIISLLFCEKMYF